MRLLVTGANGQLGTDLVKYAKKSGIVCIGSVRSDFDITDKDAAAAFITSHHPDVVIHCAAYNAVDKAEEESVLCYKTNAEGTANVAAACKLCNAKMVHISTDYVFDGTKVGPYDVEDVVNPLSEYGKSKAEAEKIVQQVLDQYYIVRTSWLYGEAGGNFVKTMLSIAKSKEEVTVVSDQIGSPTYTADLAARLLQIARSGKYGIYHATNEGFCSWAEFASEIMAESNSKCSVIPIDSSIYPSRAIRPKNSRLSKESLLRNGFDKLPSWRDALIRYLKTVE